MGNNDFQTNLEQTNKKDKIKNIRGFIYFAILLTGIVTFAGGSFVITECFHKGWKEIGTMELAHRSLLTSITACAFVALLKIVKDANPFSNTLILCIRVSAWILMIASIAFPRLPDYQSSGFEIFSTPTFVLIDGFILMPGLLLFILSVLMKTGFEMQNEIEEIL